MARFTEIIEIGTYVLTPRNDQSSGCNDTQGGTEGGETIKQIIQILHKVENLIDRVWTEENGRPPNIHKQVIMVITYIK